MGRGRRSIAAIDRASVHTLNRVSSSTKVGFEPTTFRLRVRCFASDWPALVGSCLLTLDAASVQTAPDGYRRIVWMIIGMIKAHSIPRRMRRAQTASSVVPPQSSKVRRPSARAELGCRIWCTAVRGPPSPDLKPSGEVDRGVEWCLLAGRSSESGDGRCCVVMARNGASYPVPLTSR
jgi:hypothetical protein